MSRDVIQNADDGRQQRYKMTKPVCEKYLFRYWFTVHPFNVDTIIVNSPTRIVR